MRGEHWMKYIYKAGKLKIIFNREGRYFYINIFMDR
tara:strand:+ start:876 stop:983 length:108 start_codon:yes stop_codon:yes gene_type:complete